jgi:hypothetical protein
LSAVTVYAPAVVAVHELPVQDPLGTIENVVEAVTSPNELPKASKPWTVNAFGLPALVVALEGLITM